MYWALLQVTGGLAAVVLAVVPLITALLSALQRLERLTARAVAGAVLALAGILWITIGQDDLVVPLGGLMALVAAGFVVAQSVIVGKKVADNHPVMTNAVGMAFAAPLLLGISLVAGEEWAAPTTTQARWALVYLCTIGSVGLFIVVLLVIRRWTANASAYVFVLIPIVTLLLEAWLLDVPLTVRAVTGALLVMTGVWFGALSAPDLSADAEVSPRGRSPRR
jgi:drug/metabolite transporter (DMT)-like permease